MNTPIQLSDAELKIMQVLWEHSPQTMAQITQALYHETAWTKNTVITLLKRMITKGTVLVDETVFPKTYAPLVEREALAKQETKSLLKRLFQGSHTMLMSNMVEEGNLTNDELDEMIRLLQKAKEERS
ncbi:MAG: BlaI/MecI/CopY family transcriptional regulator [Candidatus Limiplasma sp.]|nr:BlaI/MecI/CopY family transcriptional regulator [Candidatus Limiplasma sp.]